jgi:hypothetical protein
MNDLVVTAYLNGQPKCSVLVQSRDTEGGVENIAIDAINPVVDKERSRLLELVPDGYERGVVECLLCEIAEEIAAIRAKHSPVTTEDNPTSCDEDTPADFAFYFCDPAIYDLNVDEL